MVLAFGPPADLQGFFLSFFIGLLPNIVHRPQMHLQSGDLVENLDDLFFFFFGLYSMSSQRENVIFQPT